MTRSVHIKILRVTIEKNTKYRYNFLDQEGTVEIKKTITRIEGRKKRGKKSKEKQNA